MPEVTPTPQEQLTLRLLHEAMQWQRQWRPQLGDAVWAEFVRTSLYLLAYSLVNEAIVSAPPRDNIKEVANFATNEVSRVEPKLGQLIQGWWETWHDDFQLRLP